MQNCHLISRNPCDLQLNIDINGRCYIEKMDGYVIIPKEQYGKPIGLNKPSLWLRLKFLFLGR